MTIRHLRIFIMVAESGSMTMAAKLLFISQPSVSQAIREIEENYDVRLFERLSKKLYITESGQLLLEYARHIVKSFDEMEVELKNTGKSIRLRIGATITVGTCMLPPMIQGFEKKQEDVVINVVVNNTNIIQQMILNSQLDVGIVEGEVTHQDIIKVPIYRDNLVVVVGKEHPFYGEKEISIQQLSGQDLICREEGSGLRELFEQILIKNQVKMNIKWCSTNTEAIKNATVSGQGISLFSTLMIEEELKNQTLHIVPINGVNISRDICVIYHKNKFLSENLKQFMTYLDER
ncbi:MAG: LysR family transcriptional regulator [Turicibacter sp.]